MQSIVNDRDTLVPLLLVATDGLIVQCKRCMETDMSVLSQLSVLLDGSRKRQKPVLGIF